MHVGKYFYNEALFKKLPGFKKSIYVFKNMYLKGFQERKTQYYRYLDRFYKEKGLSEQLGEKNWEEVMNGIDRER